jgi:hypothetical protein
MLVDTFSEWVEALSLPTEKAQEVIKVLIQEIIPQFHLPHSFQSDNSPAFQAKVTQGVSRSLGIKYHLHCAWRSQCSGKVKQTNGLLKHLLAKLAQETHLPWPKLPLALLHLRNTQAS